MIFGKKEIEIRALDFQFISCSPILNGDIAARTTPQCRPKWGGEDIKDIW
jgi:hypothetical protein